MVGVDALGRRLPGREDLREWWIRNASRFSSVIFSLGRVSSCNGTSAYIAHTGKVSCDAVYNGHDVSCVGGVDEWVTDSGVSYLVTGGHTRMVECSRLPPPAGRRC